MNNNIIGVMKLTEIAYKFQQIDKEPLTGY